MKSIIQEASSIAKAVEMGWLKAGKPQDFSVKIFQEAEKNFFGMTSKPAKIAIIFNDHSEPTPSRQPRQPRSNNPAATITERPEYAEKKQVVEVKQKKVTKLEHKKPEKLEARPLKPAPSKHQASDNNEQNEQSNVSTSIWNDELNTAAQIWIKDSLALLGYAHIPFSISIQRQLLKVQFATPLLDNQVQQKYLFRNLAFILMQTLRRQFKRSLRNARIVFVCE